MGSELLPVPDGRVDFVVAGVVWLGARLWGAPLDPESQVRLDKGHQSSMAWVLGAGLTFGGLGWIEFRFMGGPSLEIFYLLGVLPVTAAVGLYGGLAAAFFGITIHLLVRIFHMAQEDPARFAITLWDGLSWALGLTVVVFLMARVRKAYLTEREQARMDLLTGLLSRREFVRAAQRELDLAARRGGALSLALLDADGFKKINDVQGHDAGDRCLRIMGRALAERVRHTDLVGRLGGDEFVVLLTDTSGPAAGVVLQDVCRMTRERTAEAGVPVTLSVGLVDCRDGGSLADLLRVADGRMYESKRGEKGRVTYAEASRTGESWSPLDGTLDTVDA